MPIMLPLLLATAAAAPAPAPAATETADLRCVGTFAFLASKATAGDQRDLARAGVFYYVGRLDIEHPGIDLETAMRGVVPYISAHYAAELDRCGAEIRGVGGRLQTTGNALQKG